MNFMCRTDVTMEDEQISLPAQRVPLHGRCWLYEMIVLGAKCRRLDQLNGHDRFPDYNNKDRQGQRNRNNSTSTLINDGGWIGRGQGKKCIQLINKGITDQGNN